LMIIHVTLSNCVWVFYSFSSHASGLRLSTGLIAVK